MFKNHGIPFAMGVKCAMKIILSSVQILHVKEH